MRHLIAAVLTLAAPFTMVPVAEGATASAHAVRQRDGQFSRGPGPSTTSTTTTIPTSTSTTTTIPTSTSTSTTSTSTTSTSTTTTTTTTIVTIPLATTSPATTAPPTSTIAPFPDSPPPEAGATFGFAEQAGLTGGLGREPYVVTSTADSGPGTYRDALSHGSRYISFAPALAGATIRLASAVSVDGSHLTIDGSTSRVTISGFATKFSGTDIVIAGVTFAQMTGSSDEDAVTFRNASTDQVFALYGNTFKTATDGLVDIIWNGGNDVYATICGNRFEAHDKAMLIHSGDATREGGQYHVTLCRNLWTDVYQRAPYTRDAFVHQYNDVFVDYGKPDGSGGGAKSGASSFRSQHLVENSIARPRAVGTTTWTGELVTKPRTEFAGPHMGDDGNIRVIGSLLLANGGPQATQKESNPVAVFAPSYSYPVRPADSALFQAVVTGAGTCPAVAESRVNPCGGLAGSA